VPLPHRRLATSGITLVELLLVLALLVIIGSLAAPAVTNSFASVRLRRAGDKVVTTWAQARTKAIETGVPCQFRFMPESGQARLEAWSPAQAADATPAQTPTTDALPKTTDAAAASTVADPTSADDADVPTVNLQLPEPVKFHNGESLVDDPLSHEARVDQLATSTGASWSTPILFFPDGTTSQAAVTLVNDRQQYLRVTLRGLTGTARASAVLSREELDRSGGPR
jgi:type II secretory pathway pseudopilin PulG